MASMFHVSSTRNRRSIEANGLDSSRMDVAPGIAGSSAPEADGVFLCRDRFEARFFVRLNNTGGPVDVWQVDGVPQSRLAESNGYTYLPGRIGAEHVTLVERDVQPQAAWSDDDASGTAYRSSLTVFLDDGTELTGDAAQAFIRTHLPS